MSISILCKLYVSMDMYVCIDIYICKYFCIYLFNSLFVHEYGVSDLWNGLSGWSQLELELHAAVDSLFRVEELEQQRVGAAGSDGRHVVLVLELDGVAAIETAGEGDHLLVQEHSVELDVDFGPLELDGLLGGPRLRIIGWQVPRRCRCWCSSWGCCSA